MMHRGPLVAVFAASLVVVLGAGAALAGAAENRSYVRPSLPSDDGPPFSGAVRVGNTLYLAGDIGLTADQKTRSRK